MFIPLKIKLDIVIHLLCVSLVKNIKTEERKRNDYLIGYIFNKMFAVEL